MKDSFTVFKQEVHNQRGQMIGEINTNRERHETLKDRVNELLRTVRTIEGSISHSGPITKQFMDEANSKIVKLEERVKQIAIKQHLSTSKIETQKSYITVTAESKGPLTSGEIFSFGNAGKSANTGYVMIKSGRIIGMGLISDRSRGTAHVHILVNSGGLIGSEIILEEGVKKKTYNI